MPDEHFHCRQCGHCCLNLADAYTTTVDERDIHMWESAGRWDIIDWVETYEDSEGKQFNDIWINPRTREEVRRCPWLRKLPNKNRYVCRIHDCKPEHCRDYPISKWHAKETGCPAFDVEEASDPR